MDETVGNKAADRLGYDNKDYRTGKTILVKAYERRLKVIHLYFI